MSHQQTGSIEATIPRTLNCCLAIVVLLLFMVSCRGGLVAGTGTYVHQPPDSPSSSDETPLRIEFKAFGGYGDMKKRVTGVILQWRECGKSGFTEKPMSTIADTPTAITYEVSAPWGNLKIECVEYRFASTFDGQINYTELWRLGGEDE